MKLDVIFQDFGGDKKNVTVIGHGRGAACLHFLVTSDALPQGNCINGTTTKRCIKEGGALI